jgi:hypothetical protein
MTRCNGLKRTPNVLSRSAPRLQMQKSVGVGIGGGRVSTACCPKRLTRVQRRQFRDRSRRGPRPGGLWECKPSVSCHPRGCSSNTPGRGRPASRRLRTPCGDTSGSALPRSLQAATAPAPIASIMQYVLSYMYIIKRGRMQGSVCDFLIIAGIWATRRLDVTQIVRAAPDIRAENSIWRRERDSNPRSLSARRFSRPVHSSALPSLRCVIQPTGLYQGLREPRYVCRFISPL